MSHQAPATSLTIVIDRFPGIAVVHCRGKLVAGITDVLSGQVRQLIPDTKRIVLDLTDLTHMDSMGLGTIVRLYVSAKSSRCDLELINIGPRIRKMLGLTNLLSVFSLVGENSIRIP